MMLKERNNVTKLAQLSLLLAIMIILGFTPLGFIMIPGLVSITIMHIPVIIGSLLMGPVYGGVLGLAFGIISLIKATTTPAGAVDLLFSPVLSGAPVQSVLLCILPRVLLGILPILLYWAIKKLLKNKTVSVGLSAALSTAFHTLTVMGLLWLFFRGNAAAFGAEGMPIVNVFLTLISINGLLELVAAVILSMAICRPLMKYLKID